MEECLGVAWYMQQYFSDGWWGCWHVNVLGRKASNARSWLAGSLSARRTDLLSTHTMMIARPVFLHSRRSNEGVVNTDDITTTGKGMGPIHALVKRCLTYGEEWLRNRPPRRARRRGWRRLRGGTEPHQASHLRGAPTTKSKQRVKKQKLRYIFRPQVRVWCVPACTGELNKVPTSRRWQ